MAKLCSVISIIFAFGLSPIIFIALKKVYEGIKVSLLEDLRNSEEIVETLKDNDARLDGELTWLDKRVSEIVSLYEVTKEMSRTLLFDEIFQNFNGFLKRNFKFTSCNLILVDGDKNTVDNIDAEILNELYRTKRMVSYEDFIAVPLITQNEIIGILNVEGLEEAALEKFLIASKQFSLGMERVRLYEKVQELAVTDGLTGVFVRRYFLEMFREEFERSLRHNFKLSFLMIDLDYFKECNDRFGHLVGDFVLKQVAKILKQNVREIDLVGRYGGEEFSLLLPETDRANANLVAERLRLAVAEQEFKAYDEVVKMTISVGISTFPDDTKSAEELLEFADRALYKAKADGRNRVIAWG